MLRLSPCSPDYPPLQCWHLHASLSSDGCRAVLAKVPAWTPIKKDSWKSFFFFPGGILPRHGCQPWKPASDPGHTKFCMCLTYGTLWTTSRRCYTGLLLPPSFQTWKPECSIESAADDPFLCNASQSCALLLVTPHPSLEQLHSNRSPQPAARSPPDPLSQLPQNPNCWGYFEVLPAQCPASIYFAGSALCR
jgi:hypothetical protein